MIIMDITMGSGQRRFAVGLTREDLQVLLDRPLDACVNTDLAPGVQLHIFGGRDDDQLREYVSGQLTYGREDHKA